MKRLNLSFWILMMSLLVLTSCSQKGEEKVNSERFVKATEVLPTVGSNNSVYNGIVKESRIVTLSFKLPGTIDQLLVQEGQYVKKGDVLAVLDQRDYKIQVQAAEAQYKQAKGEYERYLELYERKKLPENTLEKLRTGYLLAESQYKAASNSLTDTELTAPFSGIVNKKMIENFETVGPGRPIVQLIDVENLEVVISIPENEVNEMKKVTKISCDIRNANKTNIPAKLISVSEKTGNDRMFEAKIKLEGSNLLNHVKPGMVSKVIVSKNSKESNGVLVPVESVFLDGNSKYVWKINKETQQVQKQEVSVNGVKGNGLIEIISKVNVGDKVVTAGVHSLIENQKVKILPKKSKTNIGGLL